jgi:ferredoxin
MIIEKIKDEKERERLLFIRDNFPKDLTGADPNLYYFPEDDMAYLPMDRVVAVNEAVAEPGQTVLPSEVLAHFIKNASHRCIMNFCICREAMTCKDYPIDLGCLFLGDAASKIHPEIGRQASVEEALEHVRKCREAGLIHLIGRDKIDAMWLEVGPDEKLLTVCNCCPCCCLHRVSPYMPGEAGKKVSAIPGIHVTVTDACVACGACVDNAVCIFNAITMGDDRAVIDAEQCRACGRCVDECPENAIALAIEDPAYIAHTIERFTKIVDYR